jgi:hypothetical protein
MRITIVIICDCGYKVTKSYDGNTFGDKLQCTNCKNIIYLGCNVRIARISFI